MAAALSNQRIWMVQLGGALPGKLQVIVDCGLGSRLLSEEVQRARSKAARFTGLLHVDTPLAVPTHGSAMLSVTGPCATSAIAAACSAASVEAICGGFTAPFAVIVAGGALPAQYCRLECIADASPAASMAASARRRDVVVFDSANACILAIPSRPTQITMTATMTSTRLKPRTLVPARSRLIDMSPTGCWWVSRSSACPGV